MHNVTVQAGHRFVIAGINNIITDRMGDAVGALVALRAQITAGAFEEFRIVRQMQGMADRTILPRMRGVFYLFFLMFGGIKVAAHTQVFLFRGQETIYIRSVRIVTVQAVTIPLIAVTERRPG